MQVIERRTGQSILIRIGGEQVEVRLHATARGKAKIGIIAPPSVGVARKESTITHSTDERRAFAGDAARVRRSAAAATVQARRQ